MPDLGLTNAQREQLWEWLHSGGGPPCFCCVGRAFMAEPEFMAAIWHELFELGEDQEGPAAILAGLHAIVGPRGREYPAPPRTEPN